MQNKLISSSHSAYAKCNQMPEHLNKEKLDVLCSSHFDYGSKDIVYKTEAQSHFVPHATEKPSTQSAQTFGSHFTIGNGKGDFTTQYGSTMFERAPDPHSFKAPSKFKSDCIFGVGEKLNYVTENKQQF